MKIPCTPLSAVTSREESHASWSVRSSPYGHTEGLTGSESAQPLAMHLKAILKLTAAACSTGGREELDERLVSLSVECLRLFNSQGLINPHQIMPLIFGISVGGTHGVAEQCSVILKSIIEARGPTLFLSRLEICLRVGFQIMFHVSPKLLYSSDKQASSQTILSEDALQFWSVLASWRDIYACWIRKKKCDRDRVIRGIIDELRSSLCLVADDEVATRMGFLTFRQGDHSLGRQIITLKLLYAKMLMVLLAGLPFTYESEPLMLIHCANRFLALQGAEKTSRTLTSSSFSLSVGESITALVLFLVKKMVKKTYKISSESILNFESSTALKAEKVKYGAVSKAEDEAEGEISTDGSSILSDLLRDFQEIVAAPLESHIASLGATSFKEIQEAIAHHCKNILLEDTIEFSPNKVKQMGRKCLSEQPIAKAKSKAKKLGMKRPRPQSASPVSSSCESSDQS